MKKIVLISFFLFFVFLGISYADFPITHTWQDAEAFKAAQGGVADICQGKLVQIVAGVLAADFTVVHYLESDRIVSYIGTHSRALYNRCLAEAGQDLDLQCQCHGMATHLIQDFSSHYTSVPDNIRKTGLFNLVVHAPTELGEQGVLVDFLNDRSGFQKLQKYSSTSMAEVESLQVRAMNLFRCGDETCPADFNFARDGYKNKYINHWVKFTNLQNFKEDAAIVAPSILERKWSETIWNPQKYNLPRQYEFWLGGLFLFFAIFILAPAIIWGRNKWVIVPFTLSILGMIISVSLIISIEMGTTWVWFLSLQNIAKQFIDLDKTETLIQFDVEQSKAYFEQPYLREMFDDASGLSFTKEDVTHIGTLVEAEEKFFKRALPIAITILGVLLFISMWRMTIPPKNKGNGIRGIFKMLKNKD